MKVCLLITTYNRAQLLKNSLERLCLLTLPYEVLIVDDGSSDNTKQVCESFVGKLPIRYIYNHNPNWSICSFARNIGVKNTDCDIIITSEPEILFFDDVVYKMWHKQYDKPNEIISAGLIYHMGKRALLHKDMIADPFDRIKKERVNHSYDNPNPDDPKGYVLIPKWQATYVALYKKEWIEQVGGWDENFPGCYGVDDIDLCTRIRIKLGINQHVNEDITVLHQYHDKPPEIISNSTEVNMNYFHNKRLSFEGIEDKNNPNLIANQNKEWGIIKIR